MADVFFLNRKKGPFTLQEAQGLLPLIYRITENYNYELAELVRHKDKLYKYGFPDDIDTIELKIQNLIDQWNNKMVKIGVEPKGVWNVDFDNGLGYYCWKFPEAEIKFQHGYKDGFMHRRALPQEGIGINIDKPLMTDI